MGEGSTSSHSISMLRSSRKAEKVPSWYRRKQLCRDQCRTSPSLSQSPNTPAGSPKGNTGEGGSAFEPLQSTGPPQAGASLHQLREKLLPKPHSSGSTATSNHEGHVPTLCQVQDGPCHSEPLVPVDHLQPIQQVHDIGLLLSPGQLQPPPVGHCKRDTTSSLGLPWGSCPCPKPRGAEARAATLSVKILLEASPVVAQLRLLGVAVEL